MVCNKCIKNYKKAKLEFLFTNENSVPTSKTLFLKISYKGSLKCIDFYKIESILNKSEFRWIKGEIQRDNLRNTVLISSAQGSENGTDNYAAESIVLQKLKNCYRGDVIDTKYLYGEGSIANFKFL